MPRFVFSCPNCQRLFEGGRDMEGRNGKCPGCGDTFKIQLQSLGDSQSSPKQKPPTPKLTLSGASQLVREVGIHDSGSSSAKTGSNGPATPKPAKTDPPTSRPIASQPVTSNQANTGSVGSGSGGSGSGESQRVIACGSCGRQMSVRISLGGTMVACPHCQTKLNVPVFDGQPKPSVPQRPVVTPQSQNTAANWPSVPTPGFSAAQTHQPAAYNHSQLARPSTGAGQNTFFGDAFSLTFANAFPNCLYPIPVSIVIGLVVTPLIVLIAIIFAQMGKVMNPNSIEFLYVSIGNTVLVSLIGLVAFVACSSIQMHNALETVRGRNPGFFSGLEHTGRMCALVLLQAVGYLVYAGAIISVLYLLGANAIGALVFGLMGIVFSVCLMMLSFAPMAVIDGHDPFTALTKSIEISKSCPMTIAFMFVFVLLFLIAVTSTFGLALLLIGLLNQAYAAAYHLGNKTTRSA